MNPEGSHRHEVDRAAALVADVEAIPATLERVAEASLAGAVAAAVDDAVGRRRQPEWLLLAGLGSSRFAASQAEASLRRTGLHVIVEAASSDTLAAPSGDGLVIVISSGGRTPETVAVADRFQGRAPILSITRDPTSPLARAADSVVELPVAAESSGVTSTSYVATIGVLLHVAARLAADDVAGGVVDAARAAAARARAVLGDRDRWLGRALEACRDVEEVDVVGPRSQAGNVEQAALLLREAPRRSATAFETADWLHTGVYTALPGRLALLFDGSPADDEVVATVVGRAGRALRVSSLGPAARPGVPPPAGAEAALAAIVGPALLAAEWWRRSNATAGVTA